jgi:hypothetical protein
MFTQYTHQLLSIILTLVNFYLLVILYGELLLPSSPKCGDIIWRGCNLEMNINETQVLLHFIN